jgi:hypothetical protein
MLDCVSRGEKKWHVSVFLLRSIPCTQEFASGPARGIGRGELVFKEVSRDKDMLNDQKDALGWT